MLLTLSTTHEPATDLGFLLHKHPAKLHTFELAFGRAHVFYPESSARRCTAALALDVDPVALSRRERGRDGAPLEPYVNDRPYAATSFLSVALAQIFGTAMTGRSKERQALAEEPLPLEARLACVPCRGGGDALVKRLFEPLGYVVETSGRPLDEGFPAWGESAHRDVVLRANVRLADLLAHLYVLVPVLDDRKHYWVGEDEVEKLVRRGGSWLAAHPERELIAARYLKHKTKLARLALESLDDDALIDDEARQLTRDREESELERPLRLVDQRIEAVLGALRACSAERVVELGCGEGRVLAALLREPKLRSITGMDVSAASLERAAERLGVERMGELQRARLALLHGSLVYRDARISGFDAALLVEVIEHVDPERLPYLERNVFVHARPGTVVVTTPNREYNARFPTLAAGTLRHRDHRFEWTRDEFRAWAERVAARSGYTFELTPIGPVDPVVGPPTQMAVFTRSGAP